MNHKNKLTLEAAKIFIFGGKATITLHNNISNVRYTYEVTQPKKEKDNPNSIFWVSVMTGSNNEDHYTFLGSIFGKEVYRHSPKSRMKSDSIAVKGFEYLLRAIKSGQILERMEIWHEGTCCRCGRKLTTPDSIQSGIGPECARIKERKANYQGRLFKQ